jgi:glycosyltransferase involved in cell wall biosynthesis
MNHKLSVLTVTFKNASGLASTLHSLAALNSKPFEVIVVDGGSADDTSRVVDQFREALPIRFVSESDQGIYDAMNKARRLANGDLFHYLNAGDIVWGDPYRDIRGPCLLPTSICDEKGNWIFDDFVKMSGFGYCHQGMILPRNHEAYNSQLRIVADLEMVIGTFPSGLKTLPLISGGGVKFFLGGISSSRRAMRDREIRGVIFRRLPTNRAITISVALALKSIVPARLRQLIVHGIGRASRS